MTKLFAIILCIVMTLGIMVSSLGTINTSVVKSGGLRDKAITWIDNAIP